MSNKNALTKNSTYVQSLVDYIRDVKPYRCKLTETVEEFQFFDDVKVDIDERLFSKTKIAATWMYNYFSGANPSFRSVPVQRLVRPAFLRETFTVGEDENTDLSLVPHVYSKKSFDGPGVNQVFVHRGTGVEPLTESVDYFQSHGSFQFQIKQTTNANGDFDPTWSTTADDGVIATASLHTRALALDTTNPTSAVNRIRAILNEIQAATTAVGGNLDVQRELDALYAIIDVPDIPRSYEALLTYLSISSPPILPYLRGSDSIDAQQLEQEFSNLTSPLFFSAYTDMGLRQSGRLTYADVESEFIRVTDIVPNLDSDFEEWTITSIDSDAPEYRVDGSTSGFAGFLTAGATFNHNRVSFETQHLQQAPLGAELKLTPLNKIVIREGVPLETWNIIKVNSIAHDRPQLVSTRYGNIRDLNGVVGSVSLVDQTLPTTDIILTARAGGQLFDLVSTADPAHVGVVQVGTVYNDLKVGFTIQAGTTPFREGDRFFLSIENLPARAENIDLGYGYDLDPYDNDHLVYNNTNPADSDYNRKVGFYYDGRFTDYNLDALNVHVAQDAVNGRKWRMRALPTGSPIATLKKNGSGPSYSVDLTDATSGTAPDPALNSVPVYSMSGDSNPAVDLYLFYTSTFSVEYSDDDFATFSTIGTVATGNTFESVLHGIKFTLVPASRPFVAVSSDDGLNAPRVEGGDVFSFTVNNPLPSLAEAPIGLSSATVPRLIMHSDSFYEAPAATWTVSFTSAIDYSVSALQPDGSPLPGTPLTAKLPATGVNAREGASFKELGVHFTIVPAAGLAAGDKFVFTTFAEKPSYLVHGSVTGWTAPATIGKYYWNGYIGFKLDAPVWSVYQAGLGVDANAVGLSIQRLREDVPSLTYTLTRAPAAGYTVTRSDIGIVGFVQADNGQFNDTYLTLGVNGATATELKLYITAHDFTLWNSADVVILKPKGAARLPAPGERVIVEKTESARIGVSLTPGTADISALSPITIDQRFIDLDTNQSTPLSSTSPETAVLQGWLPFTIEERDSVTSIAEFSDPATSFNLRSAASSDTTIGTLAQQDPSNPNEPIIFEWDLDFFNTYLPLNAEANLVISGTGWDDKLRTRISESVKFMIGGGALAEDWLFKDEVTIQVGEVSFIDLLSSYSDALTTTIEDGPFTGFQLGFDNVPFDEVEGYDAGQPPDVYALLSRFNLSAQQRQDVLDQWNNFLLDGEPPTTEAQWTYLRAALAGDPNPTGTALGFGYPLLGLGIDVNAVSQGTAGASVQEAMVVNVRDLPNSHDVNPYDVGGIDTLDDRTAIIYSGSLPPIPTVVPPGVTYADLETPLFAEVPARVFEVSFNAPAAALAALTPTFSIWLPTGSAPMQVQVVERVALGRYRFSIPSASEAKILVQ